MFFDICYISAYFERFYPTKGNMRFTEISRTWESPPKKVFPRTPPQKKLYI